MKMSECDDSSTTMRRTTDVVCVNAQGIDKDQEMGSKMNK